MEKILDIIESIAHEKGLKREQVKEAIKTAFIQAAKRVVNEKYNYETEFDEETKSMRLYQIITVVENNSELLNDAENEHTHMALSEATEYDEEVEVGDQLQIEHSLEDYGRTGAMTLHNEIEYHIQRCVEDELYNKFNEKVGNIVSGRVTRVDRNENTFIEIDEVRAVLPMKNRIKGEKFVVGNIVKAVVRKVFVDKVNGIQIELSRTSPKFLEELLRLEVPEINDNMVVIEKSARIPGERAKIALISMHQNIDPVGATVGVKGVRINAVSDELCGENIDCIEHTAIPELFVARAMSPSIINSVIIEEDKAIVTLPSDQKSKAIGKSGINIRLASMLTGYTIELIEQDSAASKQQDLESEKKDGVESLEALFK